MKKFIFKPEKLLDYKTKLLENEKLALAALNAELAAVNGRIADMTEAAFNCREELRDMQLGGGVTPATCKMYFRYEDFLKTEIQKARKLAAQLAHKIEKQVDVIKDLRLETKSLELLKEAKLKVYRKEEIKDNERQVEEYVNTSRLMHMGFER
ncbi:MAG: flagellar FliJ family protein [Clostridiales Family XIII bacterium]|jgi:flagellar export protein FliJ|nr:flagellar FliJ family protein [Clostridiales Family XIII bacterium]